MQSPTKCYFSNLINTTNKVTRCTEINILSIINPCKKSKKRRNAEYFAMRNNEGISSTLCEKINSFIKKEYKLIHLCLRTT